MTTIARRSGRLQTTSTRQTSSARATNRQDFSRAAPKSGRYIVPAEIVCRLLGSEDGKFSACCLWPIFPSHSNTRRPRLS